MEKEKFHQHIWTFCPSVHQNSASWMKWTSVYRWIKQINRPEQQEQCSRPPSDLEGDKKKLFHLYIWVFTQILSPCNVSSVILSWLATVSSTFIYLFLSTACLCPRSSSSPSQTARAWCVVNFALKLFLLPRCLYGESEACRDTKSWWEVQRLWFCIWTRVSFVQHAKQVLNLTGWTELKQRCGETWCNWNLLQTLIMITPGLYVE